MDPMLLPAFSNTHKGKQPSRSRQSGCEGNRFPSHSGCLRVAHHFVGRQAYHYFATYYRV